MLKLFQLSRARTNYTPSVIPTNYIFIDATFFKDEPYIGIIYYYINKRFLQKSDGSGSPLIGYPTFSVGFNHLSRTTTEKNE